LSYFHEDEVKQVEFSPDGRYISSSDGHNSIRVRHLDRFPSDVIATQQATPAFDVRKKELLLFNGDSLSTFVPKRHDARVIFEPLARKDSLQRRDVVEIGPLRAIATVSQDLTLCLTGSQEHGAITVWDESRSTNNKAALLEAAIAYMPLKNPNCLAVSPDAHFAAIASGTSIFLIDLKSLLALQSNERPADNLINACIKELKGHKDINAETYKRTDVPPIEMLVFSQNGYYLASKGDDMSARVWDTRSGAQLASYVTNNEFSKALAFSANGKTLFFEDIENDILVWDWQKNKMLADLRGHTGTLTYLAPERRGKYLLSASSDHTIKLWNARSGKLLKTFYQINPEKLSWVDKDVFVSTDTDPGLKIWQLGPASK
jgi:WD40 repeat protein